MPQLQLPVQQVILKIQGHLQMLYVRQTVHGGLQQVALEVRQTNSESKFSAMQIYTTSKVKHHLNIFLKKVVKLAKHEFFLVTFFKKG